MVLNSEGRVGCLHPAAALRSSTLLVSLSPGRIKQLEQVLEDVDQEIETFKEKEVMSGTAMKNNTEQLDKLTATLDAAFIELEVRPAPRLNAELSIWLHCKKFHLKNKLKNNKYKAFFACNE